MASVLQGQVELSKAEVQELADKARNFAILNGVCMRTAENPGSSETVNNAPITLFPTLVPRRCLQEVKALQTTFNYLMYKVSLDHQFLQQSLQQVIKVDEFTRRLWEIYTTVREEGVTQPVSLSLFRNDFMMDVQSSDNPSSDSVKLKQIEFNTIASSFGGLVTQLTHVHRYILDRAGVKYTDKQVPQNAPAKALALGMVKAYAYRKSSQNYTPTDRSAILFLVKEAERNTLDQVWLEYWIYRHNPDIPVVYKTWADLSSRACLDQDKRLIIDGVDVAVVYFRDGYSPDQYQTAKDWDTRLLIERSLAIKCPTVSSQLAGTKKIQQELARVGAVERFIENPATVKRIRGLFAGQYSLDQGSEGNIAIQNAIEHPDKYVLKPQREGGGNNLYGEELKAKLTEIRNSDERSAYILMEKIHPWRQKNVFLKYGEHSELRNVVSEIGIYGVLIGNDANILETSEAGHLMRTKEEGVNEGGVSTGFSSLDTPFLID